VAYEIEWSASALRELRKLDKPIAWRILTVITKLGLDPRPESGH
jgi:mRNA interferase RelE/StbE